MGEPRPPGGYPGRHHQGRHRASRRRGPRSRRPARSDGQRRRRGAAGDRHRRQDGGHHPGAVRHLQRPARGRGLSAAGAPHRATAGAPGGGQRGTADHLRRHPGPAGAGDHQPGMVGQRDRWPTVRTVHGERRGAQTLAHPDRPDAFLPGPRLAPGTGRAAPGVPAAAGHGATVRRTPDRFCHRGSWALRAVPHPAFEVVDPFGVPGQPVHAVAVPGRADHVDESRRRRQDRRGGQRLGGGGQPERGDGVARHRVPPDARRYGVRAPRAGTDDRRAVVRDHRQPRRHPQLADPAAGQTQPPGRRIRTDVLRLQLSRTDRQPARRGHHGAQAISGGAVLMRVMAQLAMVMNLDKCIGCHTCSVTCKQAWTNRSGVEYVWFNNVETRPGQGYPRRYEDQEQWKGGWTLNRRGRLTLTAGGRVKKLLSIFSNPLLPTIKDYYEPWTYDYEMLTDAPLGDDFPVARPKSLITGKPMNIEWSSNWDDDLGGTPEHGHLDPICL